MFSRLAAQLEERRLAGRPLRVGLVGAGRFGTSVAAQIGLMRGLHLSAVADVRHSNALAALDATGWERDEIRATDSAAIVCQRVQAGQAVITEDGSLFADAPLDAVVEATGQPEVSATVIPTLLAAGIHVINVSVESDVLLGASFRRQADTSGVIYSLADGDQPICTKRLYDWAMGLGYKVIAAGRGTKRYPADRSLEPADAFARWGVDKCQVERRRLNAQMYNSFIDGSKAQIESTAIANMTGLVPDVRGMHEPSVALTDLPNILRLCEEGGILGRDGVVELANSVGADGHSLLPNAIANGVWVVITTDQTLLREDLEFYHLPVSADGSAAVLSREYHICGLETPWSVLEASLGDYPSGTPRRTPVADVVAIAKRPLRPGETLDGSGGTTVYGLIERADIARQQKLLPLGLAEGSTLRKGVEQGTAISYDMVVLDQESMAYRLRKEQDALW